MIGILCPSTFEYEYLSAAHLERLGAKLVCSGMGKLRAGFACHRLLVENPGLSGILLIGYAGGLTEDLQVGDVVEPSLFVEQDYCAEPFEKFPNEIRKRRPKLLSESLESVMLTQDRFLTENPYKKDMGRYAGQKIACDMESYAVAHFCENSGIRYGVVKLISDSADAHADHDFLKACRDLAPKLQKAALEAVRQLSHEAAAVS